MDWFTDVVEQLKTEEVALAVRLAILLIGGLIFARIGSGLAARVARRGSAQHVMLARRGVFYVIVILVLLSAMRQLGIELSVLLGAAGILTVALGFASQTSASNVISGLFLLGERPFVVGDVIRVGTTTGEVISIDLLSVKLRTFDNLFVRVPNEELIKSEIVNLTRFEIRRVEINVQVAYKEDLARAQEVLLAVVHDRPDALEEPAPALHVGGFDDSGVTLRLFAWTRVEGWYDFRTRLMKDVKRALDDAGIEIPFPHLSLYAGSATEAIPVRNVGSRT